jgi:hypothetical protein
MADSEGTARRYAVSHTHIVTTDQGPAEAASRALFEMTTGQLPGFRPGEWVAPVFTVVAEDGTVTMVDMNEGGPGGPVVILSDEARP